MTLSQTSWGSKPSTFLPSSFSIPIYPHTLSSLSLPWSTPLKSTEEVWECCKPQSTLLSVHLKKQKQDKSHKQKQQTPKPKNLWIKKVERSWGPSNLWSSRPKFWGSITGTSWEQCLWKADNQVAIIWKMVIKIVFVNVCFWFHAGDKVSSVDCAFTINYSTNTLHLMQINNTVRP